MTKSKSPEGMPQVIPARCACGVVRYVPMFDYEGNHANETRQSSRAQQKQVEAEDEHQRQQSTLQASKEKLLLLQQRVALVEQDYQRVNQYAEHLEREVGYLQNKVEEQQHELKTQRAQQNVSGKPGIASAIVVGQLQSEVASKSQAYAILSARYESQTAQLAETRDELHELQRREERLRSALEESHQQRSSSASPSVAPSGVATSTDELLQFLEQITKENTMLRRLLVHRDNVLAQLMIGSPHRRFNNNNNIHHQPMDDDAHPSGELHPSTHRRGSAYDMLQTVDMEELEAAYASASRQRQRSASATSNQGAAAAEQMPPPMVPSQSKLHSIHSAVEALTLAASRIQAAVSVGLAARQQGQQNDKDDNILLSEIFVEAKEAVSFGTKAMALQQLPSTAPSRSVSPQASTAAAQLPPLSPPLHRDPTAAAHYQDAQGWRDRQFTATAPNDAPQDTNTTWHAVGAPTSSKPLKPMLDGSAAAAGGRLSGGSRTVTPTPSEAGGSTAASNSALLYREAEKLRREAERCEKMNGELSLQLYCGGTVPLRKKTGSPQRHAMK